MSKTVSRGLAAAALLAASCACGPASAGAMNQGATLARATGDGDLVQIEQRRRGTKKRGQQVNVSREHKQKIMENVPREYHQYLPKSVTGGGAGAGGAGAAGAGTR